MAKQLSYANLHIQFSTWPESSKQKVSEQIQAVIYKNVLSSPQFEKYIEI